MKIIIIGAGIGGLCAGIALKRNGHDVRIYEQVKDIRPVGAAISVWQNGIKCLSHLGLGSKIAAIGGLMDSIGYVDGLSGDTMTDFSLQPLIERVGQRPYPVARAELQMMLMREFGLAEIRLGMRLVDLKDGGESVSAEFEDGTVDTGSLLIGADGANSQVRHYILGSVAERRYAGYVNWNGLVEMNEDIAPANRWTTFVGQGKRVSLMPIAGNRFYFFFDVPLQAGLPNQKEHYKSLLRGYFDGWTQQVHTLIDRLDPQTTNRVEIHDVDPFMTWAKGRVALLGDSAHNTTPDIGQGGCMAMEDAVVLSMVLQSHALSIEDALIRYQNRRNERAADLVRKARKRCDVTHAKDMAATRNWYEELRREDGSSIMQGIAATVEGGPMG
jgi:FAD-dependent urate hydroxylase